MPIKFQSLPGLMVKIDGVEYKPALSAPPDKPFPFEYRLSIHNQSAHTVTLFGRKWVVRDNDDGSTLVVEGDGIVGQFPRLEPGRSFSYNSYHVVLHGSTAQGAFFGATEDGMPVRVMIPDFHMQPPMMA